MEYFGYYVMGSPSGTQPKGRYRIEGFFDDVLAKLQVQLKRIPAEIDGPLNRA